MEITKQQLFAMYLANENQKVICKAQGLSDGYAVGNLYGITYNDVFMQDDKRHRNFIFNISDCQLILKPVSEMSEEHIIEYGKIEIELLKIAKMTIVKSVDLQNAINKNQEWLITHGYALSDKYFTNRWAVKERDVK